MRCLGLKSVMMKGLYHKGDKPFFCGTKVFSVLLRHWLPSPDDLVVDLSLHGRGIWQGVRERICKRDKFIICLGMMGAICYD